MENNGALAVADSGRQDIVEALDGLCLKDDHQPPPRSSLLGLPVELRLHIYERIPIDVTYEAEVEGVFQTSRRIRGKFAILLTSKQIYEEAAPILYGTLEPGVEKLKHAPKTIIKHIHNVFVICLVDYERENYPERTYWSCHPALTLSSSTQDWTLDTMWRYIARAAPETRHINIAVDTIMVGPSAHSPIGAKSPSSIGMPELQRVTLQSVREPEDFTEDDALTQMSAVKRALREEVLRLSPGVRVTWNPEHGWPDDIDKAEEAPS